MAAIQKDPASILDYGFRWLDWLEGDLIVQSDWSVAAGDVAPGEGDVVLQLTPDKPAVHDGKTTRVWLHGGVLGATYSVVNRIRTQAGRVDERTMTIVVRNK